MKRTVLLAALFAAGCAAALSLGVQSASAWSPGNLPPGWSVDHITAVGATTCPSSYRIRTDSPSVFSNPYCEDSPTYQADFDAWVNSHYTPPPAPPSTTAPATTTVVVTTTAPATTTVAPAATTAPAPGPTPAPPTTTAPAPAPAPVTTAPTLTPVEQSLQDQINALSAKIAALTDRVARVEKATDAAWLAYQQSLANGDGPVTAAGIARGTFLNAIYQLGAFAPKP